LLPKGDGSERAGNSALRPPRTSFRFWSLTASGADTRYACSDRSSALDGAAIVSVECSSRRAPKVASVVRQVPSPLGRSALGCLHTPDTPSPQPRAYHAIEQGAHQQRRATLGGADLLGSRVVGLLLAPLAIQSRISVTK